MRALVAVSFMAVILAGCSGSPGDDGAAPDEPTVITDPRDFSDLNGTGAHTHDYWGGQSQLDLLDYSLQSGWNNMGGSYAWSRVFSPPDEHVVPQGTSSLTVTVDWSDSMAANNYGQVSLWVKPANSAEHRFVQAVEKGTTVEVPTLYEEADLPHQLISAWEFKVQYNSSGGQYNLFVGSTHLKVVAHRGLELQPFPAHPDQWHGRTAFEFLNVTDHMENIGYTGTGDLPHKFRPENGSLVPSDAAYVDVTLRVANDYPVGGLQLWYHAADSRTFVALEPESQDQGVLRYTIDIEPGMGDGPYNDASLWEFQVYTQSAAAGNDPALYSGDLQITAVVHAPAS